MAQSAFAPITTGSLSQAAAAPFIEREQQIATKIAYADKAVSQSGVDELSADGLAPNMSAVVSPWISAIKRNMTEGYYSNDMTRVNEAKAQARQLQEFISSGKLATNAANNSYLMGQKSQWRGVSMDKESGLEAYRATTAAPINYDLSPSGYPVLKSDDGGYASMMDYKGLNPENYFIITEASDLGANWDPRTPLSKHAAHITGIQNESQAVSALNSRFEDDYTLGAITDEDIAIHYLITNDQISPENAGTDEALAKIVSVKNSEALMAKALDSYKNSYVEAGRLDWEAKRQAELKRDASTKASTAPKYTTQRVTVELGGKNIPVTQYVSSSVYRLGNTRITSVYQGADGIWYGDVIDTVKQGSRTIENKILRKLSSSEVNFVTGQLNLKGASTTGRASRAAAAM
jgi:hypothetical protein